jgi:hypothetical protein
MRSLFSRVASSDGRTWENDFSVISGGGRTGIGRCCRERKDSLSKNDSPQ